MKSVAIVICNYNKRDFVLDCIDSVLKSTFTDFDVIVVDNASTDGSVEAIQERFGERVTVLVNPENIGGSGGFNRGMVHAMSGGYQYIHLLDNDITVDENAVGALFDFMESHNDVGVCGSLTCRMTVRDRIQDFGAMIDLEHLGVTPLYSGKSANEPLPDVMECDYVAACSAMFRAEILQKTGAIDKDYFIYWDDMALCFEVRKAGYKVCAISKSVVWHYGSYGDRTAFSRYYSLRNKIHYFTKNLPDNDFERFKDILINMMYRTFAVNINNPDYINNYFFALDDALNGVRGKTDDFKIVAVSGASEKFRKVFSSAKRVLMVYDKSVSEIDRVKTKIESVTAAKIFLYSNSEEVPQIDGIEVVDTDIGSYDLTIQFCYHILDVNNYDHGKIYIDKYGNEILDEADFKFYENYEQNRAFFNSLFEGFIRGKLNKLRSEIR